MPFSRRKSCAGEGTHFFREHRKVSLIDSLRGDRSGPFCNIWLVTNSNLLPHEISIPLLSAFVDTDECRRGNIRNLKSHCRRINAPELRAKNPKQ